MVYYSRKGAYPGDTDADGFIDNDATAWDSLAYYSIAFKKPSPYGTDYKLDTAYVNSVNRNVIKVVVPYADARVEIDKLIDDGTTAAGALITRQDTLVYVIE